MRPRAASALLQDAARGRRRRADGRGRGVGRTGGAGCRPPCRSVVENSAARCGRRRGCAGNVNAPDSAEPGAFLSPKPRPPAAGGADTQTDRPPPSGGEGVPSRLHGSTCFGGRHHAPWARSAASPRAGVESGTIATEGRACAACRRRRRRRRRGWQRIPTVPAQRRGAWRAAPVRAGALHAPDIVPVTAADAARFAASARRRRCMATSGSTCAPRATPAAARCGASSFRPAHPGGSMSPSATRPASRRAASAAGAASPGDSSRIIVRATVGRAAGRRGGRRAGRAGSADPRRRDRAGRPRTDGTAPSRCPGRVAPESRLLGRRRRSRRAERRRSRPFPPPSPAACGDGGASPRAGSLRRRVRRCRAVGALIRAAPHGRRSSPMSPPPPRAMLRA